MDRIVKAFWHSLDGLKHAARTEAAVKQELILLTVAAPLALLVGRGPWERAALIGVILLMICVELLNTAIEKLCDHVTPERSEHIKIVKDLGSAAVFMLILLALLIWGTALAGRFA